MVSDITQNWLLGINLSGIPCTEQWPTGYREIIG